MEQRDQGRALVTFQEVSKTYHRRQSLFSRQGSEVKALDRVSLEIYPGEIFSLVGESGSGKTTCGRLLVLLEERTSGSILFDGLDLSSLRGKEVRRFRQRAQMIFQDPYQSLNPQLTIFQTAVEPLLVQGFGTHRDREAKVGEMLEEVGLRPAEDFLFRYPHQLSGGQRQRVAVARAMILEPEFVVADEPVSMLDASIQAQLLNMLLDLKERHALTLLFITHDLATARYVSDRIGVIYRGRMMEHGPAEAVIRNPMHPYTRALIDAVPSVRRRKEDLPSPACPVDLFVVPWETGCPFSARCPNCSPRCQEQEAALQEVERDHYAACFLHYG
jgi:peptide/nickel transport system ATP-binding protein